MRVIEEVVRIIFPWFSTPRNAQNPRFLNWNCLKAGTSLVPAKAETFASKYFDI
ncbi:MAG: hypothetical protein F6K54_35480 [Okeania sp. SIO3B5]|uniref:hypothetical protein n=1 Tax=Okeania sp. SIO3B5 TaxID=2607811 RepID=UPI001400C176|nr:hypothetical protein [Okeania sp. SIO3B5]NEO57895.1 hypothetical protein [Okeania sp. SIO3B5]